MAPPNTVTTSYLLGNLHCPSCVAFIKSLLDDEFADKAVWVSPNVVTSVVTVEHEDASVDFIRAMAKTLQDVGFDVCAVDTTAAISPTDFDFNLQPDHGTFALWSRLWRNKTPPGTPGPEVTAAHRKNCDACRSATGHDQHEEPDDALSEDRVRLVRTLSSAPSLRQHLSSAPSLRQHQSSVPMDGVVVDDGAPPPLLRATVSIGSMTCAVCANTITDEVQKHPWISKVTVNLVSNSASVDFTDPDRANQIIEAISDLGYDAVLDKVVDLNQNKQAADEREVEIQVDGIFCHRCPDRVCQTLRNLDSSRIQILQEPTVKHPRLKVRYVPAAPRLTIRDILLAIEATDPSLQASIHHPPTLEERSRAIRAKHHRELLYREILTVVIAVPSFVLGIVYMSLVPPSDPTRRYLMQPWKSGLSRLDIALFVLATPVFFLAADVFHVRAIKELRSLWRRNSRTPLLERFYKFGSMNMLISLGTGIAYISSVVQMIVAAVNHQPPSEGSLYFDSVVFLTLFLLAGRLIEGYSKSKTGSAIEALAGLRPSTALLIEQDRMGKAKTTATEIDRLELGDLIRIPNGASPAADGVVVAGETSFDESSLTGESRPIKKGAGDSVYAGTINHADAVTVRITGTGGKSMLDQIVEVVREGQTKRAPAERIADLMTSYFVPVVTLIAVVTWAVWMGLGFGGHVSEKELAGAGGPVGFALQFAIAVFVVACPCGLALAAPTAIFVGGGIAAKHGVLAKGGGEAFEKASKIDCVVFDKTGTLTVGGEPRITDSALFPDGEMEEIVDERTLLAGLKATEESSSHPIARAIVGFCGAKREAAELGKVEELPGKGIRASLKDETLDMAVGNEHLMRDLSVPLSPRVTSMLQGWKGEAKSVALMGVKRHKDGGGWKLAAVMAISDQIRPEARAVVQALQAGGRQVWMLSGDNLATAQAVAQRVGIPAANVLAEVLPSEKAAKMTYLQATLHADDGGQGGGGRRQRRQLQWQRQRRSSGSGGYSTRRAMVAMVGDGINDSPALTTADVGIAIGSGSDVAISSADFVLATSSLSAVLTLLDLSRVVFRRIKVNFGWSVVYNMLAVPIAAGCLYAVRTRSGGHVRLEPVWAALAMALSSISVVLSSLSLRVKLPWIGFRARVTTTVEEGGRERQ